MIYLTGLTNIYSHISPTRKDKMAAIRAISSVRAYSLLTNYFHSRKAPGLALFGLTSRYFSASHLLTTSFLHENTFPLNTTIYKII